MVDFAEGNGQTLIDLVRFHLHGKRRGVSFDVSPIVNQIVDDWPKIALEHLCRVRQTLQKTWPARQSETNGD